MHLFRRSSFYCLLCTVLNLGSGSLSGQTINSYLIGQNAWLPEWHGGEINQLWDEVQTAGFQTIRIGGNAALSDNKDLTRVIQLIDGVQSAGAEPIVQVPHDFSTQETIDYINYINVTMARDIKLWCVGNEPSLNNLGNVAAVGTYLRRIGTALKSVDPNAIVMGPELGNYNTSYLGPLIGGSEDITGIDANGNYPIDIITWHEYNFNTIETVEANVDDMIVRLATANASRPAGKKLQWGLTETNTHYDMDLVSDPKQYTWSFHAGQIYAELYDMGMRKGGFTICPWSIHENVGERSGTDLSLFDSRKEGFPGRSTYYHSLMLGQNARSTYLEHSDNQSDVKIVGMADAIGTSVMILNKDETTAFNYSLKLDGGTPTSRPLEINVLAGLDVEHLGTIPAFATQLLVFDEFGALTTSSEYTALQAAAQVGPGDGLQNDFPILHYEMGQAEPQLEDPQHMAAGGALAPGAGLAVFNFGFVDHDYISEPSLQANFTGSSPDLATAVTNQSWLTFDLTVGEKVSDLDLTRLTFNAARGGISSPRGYAVYVDTPMSTNELIQGATDLTTARPNWGPQDIDLSNVASLQNLIAGQVVTFRLPLYSPGPTLSIELDDLIVWGHSERPFFISNIEQHAESTDVTWTSTPGEVYGIEYSTDLETWATCVSEVHAAPHAFETTTNAFLHTSIIDASLLHYEMGLASPQILDPIDAVTGGDLTPGSGLDMFSLNFSPYPNPPALTVNFNTTTTSMAQAISNDSIVSFEMTVGANVMDLDLTELSFNAARGGGSTPRGYGILVTTPTSTLEQVQAATDLQSQRPDWGTGQVIDLSTITSLQNLSSGETVLFSIPVYSPNAVQSIEFDDIVLRGNIETGALFPAEGDQQLFLRIKKE